MSFRCDLLAHSVSQVHNLVSLDEASTLYCMLSEMLHAQPGWERSGSGKGPFDLLFAKVHGMDVPYDALGPTQAVNYFRGCQVLTRKAETHRPLTVFCRTKAHMRVSGPGRSKPTVKLPGSSTRVLLRELSS